MSEGGMIEYSICSEGNTKFIFTSLDKTEVKTLINLLNTAHNKYLLEARGLTKPLSDRYFIMEH
mgnify:FL=1